MIDGYESGLPDAAAAELSLALAVFEQTLADLVALGAQHVIVLNVPDLSLTPDAIELEDPAAIALARALSLQWNAGLEQIILAQESPGVVLFDVAALFDQITTDPAAYGITNLLDQAISTPGDDREFLFWDGVHPTASVHRILAERMQSELVILPLPIPIITGIAYRPAGPSVRIEFDSHPQQSYSVEFSTSLADGWRELRGDLASQGEVTSFVDTIGVATSGQRGYYRIRCTRDPGRGPELVRPAAKP